MQQHEREELVFQEFLLPIKEAMKQKKCLEVLCYGKYRKIEPYFISSTENESSKYIYSYCYKRGEYVVYRLSNIDAITLLDEKQKYRENASLKETGKHFSPFLGKREEIVVRLTEKGELYLKKFNHNRPKQIGREENIFHFKANEFQARLYFASFLQEAEIIKPKSLRNTFKEAFERGASLYQD